MQLIEGKTDRENAKCSTSTPDVPLVNHRAAINWIDFAYPSEKQRRKAIASGDFIQGNSLILDIHPHYEASGKFRLFATSPRNKRPGIPASLGVIHLANPSVFIPYPDWSYFENAASCPSNRIVSVNRLQVLYRKLFLFIHT